MLQRMRVSHSIRATTSILAIVATALLATGRATNAQTSATSSFTVLFRGTPVGSEQVAVERTPQGWTISSSGRIGAPLDVVLRSLQLRYDAQWQPLALSIDVSIRDQSAVLRTTVSGSTATNELTPLDGAPVITTQAIDAAAVLLPSPHVAPFEALAARLRTADAGSTVPIAQPRGGSSSVEVGESSLEQIQTLNGIVRARRTRIGFAAPGALTLPAEIWSDENGRLLRVSIPAQTLEFVREDIASVSARIVTMARPNDEDVRVPATGFSLAGTLSKPVTASGPLAAVVLVSGSGLTDRDETVASIQIFGQVSEALANAGFMVLRYDKRGVGQSGGRTEVATLTDFSDDARAAVQFLSGRKDVDRKRIAVIGHSEGGWVAMLAAARNNRVAAVGLISTGGVTGADLNLYQVMHGLERSNRPEAERQATLALQKQIQQAVVTGRGWEATNIAASVRRQADTPYFQSFLVFDPAKAMKNINQPILVVQGDLDAQMPQASAGTLETLAKGRKKNIGIEVVRVPGINHLLVPAKTGEVDEYGTLTDRQVSAAVPSALVAWLQKTLTAR